jgi:hypothetical protein
MVSSEEIVAGIVGFVAGIIIAALGMALADWFREYRNRLKPHIENAHVTTNKTATSSSGVIGFGISIDQGETLNAAYVKFNGQRYPWIEGNIKKDEVKLLVGEDSKWFFPYSINLEYISDLSTQQKIAIAQKKKHSNHGILVKMLEVNTGTVVFSYCFETPKGLASSHAHMHMKLSKFSLTLLSEGLTHETKLSGTIYLSGLRIGKLENGVPYLDTTDFDFTVELNLSLFGSWVLG